LTQQEILEVQELEVMVVQPLLDWEELGQWLKALLEEEALEFLE
jgi:hypothetical protein